MGKDFSRREFLAVAAGTVAAHVADGAKAAQAEKIIDIHQHTNYVGRSDDDLVAHQRALGVSRTVLLPAGRRFHLAAQAFGNHSVVTLARRFPNEFVYFANEVPDIPDARREIEKYLKLGAKGIGEQKFKVDCDSPAMRKIAEIAQEFRVPVLMHFEHGKYNLGIERFHKMLAKYPTVNFIGHAQTWWGNIDRNHNQTVMYPRTKVTPGGITDRLLSDYPNMYGDLSAGSGLNSLLRDEEHAREFLTRHQDKLLWGSDCPDNEPNTDKCIGGKCLAALRRLCPSAEIREKIFWRNAARVIKFE